MGAGKLQRKLTVQEKTTVADGAGGFTKTWATYVERFAEVIAVGGRENVEAGEMQTRQSYIGIVRRDDTVEGITSAMRLQMDGVTFKIHSVRRGRPNGTDFRKWVTIGFDHDFGENTAA